VRFETLTDEQLVVQIRRGERQAFVELVNRYKGRIYSLAYRMLGDHGFAEDIAQDTFLRVYESMDRFRVSRKFSAWIYRIATNLCIDHLRKEGRIRTQSADQPVPGTEDFYPQLPSEGPEPELVAIRHRLQERLQQLIAELPPKYRAVLVLRYTEDLAYQEIADILGSPLGTVKTRLFRAREALRRRLEEEPGLRALVNELMEAELLPEPEPIDELHAPDSAAPAHGATGEGTS